MYKSKLFSLLLNGQPRLFHLLSQLSFRTVYAFCALMNMLFSKLLALDSFAAAVFALALGETVNDISDLESSLAGFVNINKFQGNGLNLTNNFDAGIQCDCGDCHSDLRFSFCQLTGELLRIWLCYPCKS